jgi:hypothetical protein
MVLYSWVRGGRREEERVLPFPVFAPIFVVKISAFWLKRFGSGDFGKLRYQKR